MLSTEDLEHRFGSGKKRDKSVDSIAPVHRDFREIFKSFAAEVDSWLPEGRYKDLTMNDIENAQMWAHKSIQNDL